MPRFHSLSLAGLLLLGACAAGPETMTAGPGAASGGIWIVTDAFPAGAVTDAASVPRGQRVRLDAAVAGDPAGRICPWPEYGESRTRLGDALGAARSGGELDREVVVLEVRCAGQRFARYAVQPDGSLLHRHGPWLLRLEHGEKLAGDPAPMTLEAPMPTPPATASPPPPMAEIHAPPPPVLVYLASYRTEVWARKGWTVLAAGSAGLRGLEPVTREVEIKGKGKFVRLFAPAPDAAAGKAICKDLGKVIGECGAAGREK
ncbi:hypothetical protein [Magnetospirillum sp. SS-4]|uniref:hypothetical protein n=1 Tax=Magnetospirillum sp. SS-4 TaxID=2681465 RepID=UPI00137F9479|nr:hypothetical protein [Magnetospirillum sp. SS-4]CAA7612357.1 conserved exported hypothetical protein [Magnetospirillum sp. SS-4]